MKKSTGNTTVRVTKETAKDLQDLAALLTLSTGKPATKGDAVEFAVRTAKEKAVTEPVKK